MLRQADRSKYANTVPQQKQNIIIYYDGQILKTRPSKHQLMKIVMESQRNRAPRRIELIKFNEI